MKANHELKEILWRFKGMNNEELKFEVSQGENLLMATLLKHIGSTDSEFRDQLIYSTFHRLIDEEMLSLHSLKSVLRTCLDQEHLFLGIGEELQILSLHVLFLL
ncbi:hypothetical protein QMA09_15030 [Planococcus sp. APC 3906]|uniref:hypothetical protein n=1 Tax=Planococcus sp. APC 3906 TaxID=3035194 RepID=UPI0025B2B2DB|nr:hypothetical protein [Planococcus sp. APC 3906]MDN3451511.1 hypothetical protein [Planococcus sp. APC 3906]